MKYYRTKEGRYKRKIQNGKRRRQEKAADTVEQVDRGEDELNAGVVAHVRMAVRLIEGRHVGREEIVELLRRVLRQHRLVGRRTIDYIVGHLNKDSP